MEREFRLAPHAVRLLDETVSRTVLQARCIGPSSQSAVPEPGIFCQAVVFQSENEGLVIKPICASFGDVEVFWLSVIQLNDAGLVEEFASMDSVYLPSLVLGTVARWDAIEETITFERKAGESLKARIDSGLLFQFDEEKRILIRTAPLPFFIECFIDQSEIDGALCSVPSKRP